jgi:hypothetical protein
VDDEKGKYCYGVARGYYADTVAGFSGIHGDGASG